MRGAPIITPKSLTLKNPALEFFRWCEKYLCVPSGHPRAGEAMAVPKFGKRFLEDVLNPGIREGLLCVARKNAKSALVSMLLLGHLVGPVRFPGFRAGVLSVSKGKARELISQIEAIAQASNLTDQLDYIRTPWPGRIESSTGCVEVLSSETGGHSSSFDLSIIDEIGLMGERHRETINSMRSAVAAKDGKFLSLSIFGSGPFIPEILERKDDPETAVHVFQAPKDCELDDQAAWRAANPGLGSIKSVKYMNFEARRAGCTPADESFFRAHDLNQPGEPSAEMICSPSDWAGCRVEELPERDGRCVIGLDLGGSRSMTSAVALWPATGRLECWGAFPSVPDIAIRQRKDSQQYALMIRNGELQLFEGRVVPVVRFLNSIADRLAGQKVLGLGSDRYRRAETQQYLSDARLPWPRFWRGTGASATADGSADVRSFQRMVLGGDIRHGGGLLMASAISDAVLRFDGAGNPALDKNRQNARIDAVSAAVIACGLSEKFQAAPTYRWRYAGIVG